MLQPFLPKHTTGYPPVILLVIQGIIMSSPQSGRPASSSAAGSSGPGGAIVASPMQSSPVIQKLPGQEVDWQSVRQSDIALVSCVFGCGPPRPIAHMVNTATHTCPRWMCSPCNGARKAIEMQCNKNPNAKAALNHLKKLTWNSGNKR